MKNIIMLLFIMCASPVFAEQRFTDHDAVLSIIGEAENQGFLGMECVAFAIRNRNSLIGVYGLANPRVTHHKYSKETYKQAVRAWMESAHGKDITNGAIGWGNKNDIEYFKNETEWWNNCIITAHIGDHYFYKDKRKKHAHI